MFRIIRTRTLRALRADTSDLTALRPLLAETQTTAQTATDSAVRAEAVAETLRTDLAHVTANLARAEGELTALRAQHLLDTEDRVTLRALLRTARRRDSRPDRVYALYRRGALHSLHTTQDAAEIAAESAGADRAGWTAGKPGAALPPAAEVPWRIQALPLL